MRKLALAIAISALALSPALAQETCQSKAIGKDGKPLAGAAKTLKQYLNSAPRLSQRQLAANLDGMLEAAGAQGETDPQKKILWIR